MSEFLASYVLRVLFSTLVRRTEAIRLRGVGTGWRLFPFEPNRPELQYIRGAGPKRREKHERGAGQPQHN